MKRPKNATVVGSGPNGLGAAIVLAQAGLKVRILEAQPTIGGGTRSAELTLPGFIHDVCSAIHPLALVTPFFPSLQLERFGLRYVQPPIPLAHPLDGGRVVLLRRSVDETAQGLGRDRAAYLRLMSPFAIKLDRLMADFFGPFRIPRRPLLGGWFGLLAIQSAAGLARRWFKEEATRAIFGGMAAHSFLPLGKSPSAAYGLMLGASGHRVGWPLAEGGSQRIADALLGLLADLDVRVEADHPVTSTDNLPAEDLLLFDVTPRQLVSIAGQRLTPAFRRILERYRYGPGVFKLDYALDGPVPWAAKECEQAGTLHLGGTLEELAESERAVGVGRISDRPFVLVAQPTLFDPTRAPRGKHTLWAYCHVPNGSKEDMTARVEAQIERFAPGFQRRILARNVMSPADVERHNANCIGGDINGGAADLRQFFIRPSPRLYSTSDPLLYICSSSTPPTGGVHGMCGYYAASRALRRLRD
jgi:phytoene dehydrogenase-like protein